MRTITTYLILFFFISNIMGCSDDKNNPIPDNEFEEGNEKENGKENEKMVLKFEKDTLFVPKEGGNYKIRINSNTSYKFPIDHNIGLELYSNLGIGTPEYEKNIEDGYLSLFIKPASSLIMIPDSIRICSSDETLFATLYIKQSPDPAKEFSDENTKNLFSGVLSSLSKSLEKSYLTEGFYTHTLKEPYEEQWREVFNHNLSANSRLMYSLFVQNYNSLFRISYIIDSLKDRFPELELPQVVFHHLKSIVYYHNAILWGNVPYVKNYSSMNPETIQLKEKDLFNLLEYGLLKCIELSPSEKNKNYIYISKDSPRGILARMYIQTKEYTKALLLLNDIINNNQYSISSTWEKALDANSNELIFSLNHAEDSEYTSYVTNSEKLPVLTYTEILLLASECELKTGNAINALKYINIVKQKRGKPQLSILTLENELKTCWKEELQGSFSYFAFLKRNDLAEKELGILPYQLLFPIPTSELYLSPDIIQNPGY